VNFRTYQIVINGRPFTVDLPALAAVQIRALAGIPEAHTLVVEGRGESADRLLAEVALVSLEEGPVHVYTMPQTTMG
jgi:hypothetical protein